MKENERLTIDALLTSIKWCHGILGGDSCQVCPNLELGTLRPDGLGKCRCDIYLETIRVLEAVRGGDGDGTGK